MTKFITAGNIVRLHLQKEDTITTIDVLRALKHQEKIIGAQGSYRGSAIDIVCADETTANEIATHGFDHGDRHYDLRVAAKPRTHVSVFVPIAMPDKDLTTLLARYGKIACLRRLHYKEHDLQQYENGVRVVEFESLDIAIPSRIHYAGISISFVYTGQPKTCVRCGALDHLVKACPATKRPRPNKLDNTDQQAQQQPSNPNSAMDETDESDDESEIADEPPLDPSTITTALPTKRNLTDELQATVGSKRNLITKSPTKTTKKPKSTDEPTSEDFNAFYDLLGSTDETLKFLQVSFKMTNKARSLYLQAEHGDYDSTKSGNLRLNDSPQLTQLWQKHSRKQKTADKAMDELKQLYIRHFHENTEPLAQNTLLSKLENKLLDEESESLESALSSVECFEALTQMKTGRSPGNDGLPAEFYGRFWKTIGPDLVYILNYGFERQKLTESQTQSIISLLFKKDDRLLLKNWRPISLLNVDYKICTKALANRLKVVLPSVLHPDQTCSVPGRSIFENTFLLRDIFDYAEAKQLPGAILALDQEKAFDRVDRAFLDRVLVTMNFGPLFRQWIKTLYADSKSAVTNNGWLTSYFSLERGVRQGCPLSPLLYCLIAEVLGNAIRSDPKIEGFSLPKACVTVKTSQYADDLTLTLRDSYSIKRSFVHITMYERASGCKLNRDKCEGLWIGSSRGSIERPVNIRWVADKVKILGIWLGYGDLTEFNWTQRVVKLEKILNLWKGRTLSLKGKSLIIKSDFLTSLQGLDYITESGSKGFDDLEDVVDRLGDLRQDMSWAKQTKHQLKLAKRYLKGDFKGGPGREPRFRQSASLETEMDYGYRRSGITGKVGSLCPILDEP
ncbi:hypothetical protein QZH41_003920 [Actinostola sp. cb2023]|nr:hypothetical protein QZH41_003920 [Actinostola sp. cb2023]